MENRPLRDNNGRKRWRGRLNSAAGDTDAYLLALALCLAALVFACFPARNARDALPTAGRASALPAAASRHAKQEKLALAALAPTKPDAPLTGW